MINDFVKKLSKIGFKQIYDTIWVVAKDCISVAIWGNERNPDLGDIIIKEWDRVVEKQTNGKLCLSIKKFSNDNDDEFELALNYVQQLTKKHSNSDFEETK